MSNQPEKKYRIVLPAQIFRQFRAEILAWERDTGIEVWEDMPIADRKLSSRITPIHSKASRGKRGKGRRNT